MEEICTFRPADRADRSKVPSLAAGEYALLLRITFQSQTHTLTSEEIAALGQRVLTALAALGTRLRT